MQSSEINIRILKKEVKKHFLKNGHYSRYIHSTGVAQLAKRLAKIYGIDPKKAYIAGLLHDYYKYDDYESLDIKLSSEDKLDTKSFPVLLHSYYSSYAPKKVFNIDDEHIASAIKYHVFGRENMNLFEEIILTSDYAEINRKYSTCKECRKLLFSKGLTYAVWYQTNEVIKFLESKNITVCPVQYRILEEYRKRIQ